MSVLPESEKRALAIFGEAFADPTRRELYRMVVEAGEPLSAGEAGELARVHRTVARAHLEHLAELGLVRVGVRRGPGGGRPAKVYVPAAEAVSVTLPSRRHELLGALLAQALGRLAGDESQAVAVAETIGWEYGHAAAWQRLSDGEGVAAQAGGGERLALSAAQLWLDEQGYRATVSADGAVGLRVRNCVFREVASAKPLVVCALDRGILRGLFLLPDGALRQLSSMIDGADNCCFQFTP